MTVKFDNDGFAVESGFIQVYVIDEQGIFSHAEEQFISAGCGLSANSVLTEPKPAKQGFAVQYAAGKWQYVEDHRGETVYSTADKTALTITELGEIPENYTALAPTCANCEWDGEGWILTKEKQAELFETRRKTLLQAVILKCDALKGSLLSDYPETEIESFYRQEREARDYTADKTTATPLLSQIATVRHIELDYLVSKVLEKADQLATLTGYLIGMRQHLEDLLSVATSDDDLNKVETAINEWKLEIGA